MVLVAVKVVSDAVAAIDISPYLIAPSVLLNAHDDNDTTMFLSGYIRPLCQRLSIHRFYSSSSAEFLKEYASKPSTPSTSTRPARSILEDDDTPVDLSEDNDAVNRFRTNPIPVHRRRPPKNPTPEEHKMHHRTMKQSFPGGWNPPKKLSREAMEGLRELHHMDNDKFSTPVLAEKFRISPEAVRRILKSRWQPTPDKRKKMVAKEEEYLSLNKLRQRVQERMESDKAMEAKTGQTVGVDTRDRLTFE